MFVSVSKNHVLFRTLYSKTHDLVQIFRGIKSVSPLFNGPVDFMASGLIQNDKCDFWHIDIPFAISNDEATPCKVNGAWIGANHGQPCIVMLKAENHGKTLTDIGSLWQDTEGVKYTLLYIFSPDHLGFISENIGISDTDYNFKMKISGTLTYIENGQNTRSISAEGDQSTTYLCSALNFHKKQIIAYKDDKPHYVVDGMECDYAEIQEEYDIMNPAFVAEVIRTNRPKGGYTEQPDMAVGKAMIHQKIIYRIMPDGTVLTIFDIKRLMDVHFYLCMCSMYQEKLDSFSGGIYRAIPGMLPYPEGQNLFDFTTPKPLYGEPYPDNMFLSEEYWADKSWAPDRIVDVFRDKDEHDRLGFACGYLPLFDGEPSVRKNNLEFAMHIYRTRKVYPYFLCGDIKSAVGVSYKKYFAPIADKMSAYTIPYNGKTYIYIDCFGGEKISLPTCKRATLLNKSGDIEINISDNSIEALGKKGYAILICE